MMEKLNLTVKDIINLECMKNVNVLGGHSGLDGFVKNVTVMEVPDICNWIYPGDLLLTTAYPICHDKNALVKLVYDLKQANVAALAVKPKRYLESIPQEMIDAANLCNLPLIELPQDASFSKYISLILGEILNIQSYYLKQSEIAHQIFMEIILKGGSINDIVDSLSSLIGCSVSIVDNNDDILAAKFISNIDFETENLLITERKLSNEYIDPLGSGIIYHKMDLSDTCKIVELSCKITACNTEFGRIIILLYDHILNVKDFIIIERAGLIASLILLHAKSLCEVERRYQNEFIDELLFSTQINDSTLKERAKSLGWDLDKNYISLSIEITLDQSCAKSIINKEILKNRIKDQLFCILNNLFSQKQAMVRIEANSFIMLISQSNTGTPEFKQQVYSNCERITQSIKSMSQECAVSIGIGAIHFGIEGIKKSYYEALEAIKIGSLLGRFNFIEFYESLGIYHLFSEAFKRKELEEFVQFSIGRLIAFDETNSSDLVKTLITYFEFDANIKKISKKLFIHYNTVVQRLHRIEVVTKLNLKNPDDKLMLQVGLKISNLLSNDGSSRDNEILVLKSSTHS